MFAETVHAGYPAREVELRTWRRHVTRAEPNIRGASTPKREHSRALYHGDDDPDAPGRPERRGPEGREFPRAQARGTEPKASAQGTRSRAARGAQTLREQAHLWR